MLMTSIPAALGATMTMRLKRLSADADDDNEKGNTMKTLMGLAKQYGWQAVAKNFVENGTAVFLRRRSPSF